MKEVPLFKLKITNIKNISNNYIMNEMNAWDDLSYLINNFNTDEKFIDEFLVLRHAELSMQI